ncbi:MAG TPA: winged helix-turn-helix domain-containing protein [Bryobacteraceae bacterium]|nr:winged helix-turn-helix domain-containing protein [Bryobacteraceae bacterium]
MSFVAPGLTAEHIEKYQFDEFELLPKPRVLLRAGSRIPLTPKPFDTLLMLVERAGQTVFKEELFAQVWSGAEVEENNLTQSISTLRKALGEKRGENRYIVTDPGRGYRFVAHVTRVRAEEMTAARDVVSPDVEVEIKARPSRTSRIVIIIGGSVLIATALTTWFWLHRPSVQPPMRQSIAVLRVRDLSKTSTEAWLQTALPEMLTSELAAGGKLRTIPAEDVVRWRADLGPTGDSESRSTLLRSAQNNLGADSFVLGSYVVTGTCPQCRVRVDLGVLQARTGERVGTVIDEGSAADLLDLTTRLGRRLRTELGLKADAPTLARWPAASAMREYSEGLAALRRGDPMAARQHLEIAIAADPQNALTHSALAEAWTALGYSTRANEEDRRAFDLAGSLDRLDQLGVEARYRASVQQWDRAIEIYKTVFKLFPDSLDDGLNLARAQWRAQRVADAQATLNELRRLPKPAGNDPRIDLTEASAVGTLDDYARTRALAHQAAEEAKARGARYTFARARLLEGGAMQNLNDPNFSSVQAEARQTCEAIGDRDCLSKAWRIRGNYLYFDGDFQAARQAYEQGVAIARELGNKAELANLLVGFGVVEKANRDWKQAETNLQEAVSLRIETGNSPDYIRNELAELYISMGRFTDADTVTRLAAKTIEKSGAHEDLGSMLLLQAVLARVRGQLDQAQQLAEHAVTELRRTNNPFTLSLALSELSSVHTAAGNLTQAEKDLAEEGGPGIQPENQGALALGRAELWIAKGQFQNAAQEAQKAAAAFDKAHLDDRATQAFVTAADALEMSNRSADAIAACREAGKRAALTPNEFANASAQICSWRLSSAPGNTVPPELQARIAKLHNPELKLNLDYARALRSKRMNVPNYRELCRQLADQAKKLGYITLSARATALAE